MRTLFVAVMVVATGLVIDTIGTASPSTAQILGTAEPAPSSTPYGFHLCERHGAFPGGVALRPCVFLPVVESPPSPTPRPTATATPVPSPTAIQKPRPMRLLDAWSAAGLEAGYGHAIHYGDNCGLIDCRCPGVRFMIPSLCSDGDCGGRIFECATHADQIAMHGYFAQWCDVSPQLCSHLFIDGAILVQINPSLSSSKARRYEAILRSTP